MIVFVNKMLGPDYWYTVLGIYQSYSDAYKAMVSGHGGLSYPLEEVGSRWFRGSSLQYEVVEIEVL